MAFDKIAQDIFYNEIFFAPRRVSYRHFLTALKNPDKIGR